MITEGAMLFSIIVFCWLGIKVWKYYKETKSVVIFYLSLFFFFSGAGILGYSLRTIFTDWPAADTVFLMIGGIFQISGVLAGLIFSLFLFKISLPERKFKKIFIIAVIIITGLSLVIFSLPIYEINKIAPDPYSLFSTERTEFIFITPVKIVMAIVTYSTYGFFAIMRMLRIKITIPEIVPDRRETILPA